MGAAEEELKRQQAEKAAAEQAQKISPTHVQAAFQQVPCVPGLLAPSAATEP